MIENIEELQAELDKVNADIKGGRSEYQGE